MRQAAAACGHTGRLALASSRDASMDGGAEIGNSGRRGLYRADQLARAAVRALSSHLTSPVPLSVRQSWLSRARRTHSQALHPAQLRMGLARALARGERRMMPLGMLPYLLWPTRTALQARRRDRLARDLRRHHLCTNCGPWLACGGRCGTEKVRTHNHADLPQYYSTSRL